MSQTLKCEQKRRVKAVQAYWPTVHELLGSSFLDTRRLKPFRRLKDENAKLSTMLIVVVEISNILELIPD